MIVLLKHMYESAYAWWSSLLILYSGGSRISCRGGCGPVRGAWTSDVGAFWQK